MKKILSVVTLLLASIMVNWAQVRPRVEIAANFSTFHNNDLSNLKDVLKQNPSIGARIGAAVEIGLVKGLYVAPGIVWKSGGTKFDFSGVSNENINSSLGLGDVITNDLQYLSIPINLGYRLDLYAVALSIEGGVYFSYAIKNKVNLNLLGTTFENANLSRLASDLNPSGDARIKNSDLGLGVSAALEFFKFQIRAGAEFGMINIAKESKDFKNLSIKNRQLYLGIGFRF